MADDQPGGVVGHRRGHVRWDREPHYYCAECGAPWPCASASETPPPTQPGGGVDVAAIPKAEMDAIRYNIDHGIPTRGECQRVLAALDALTREQAEQQAEIAKAMDMLSGGRLFGPDGVEAPTTLVDRIGYVLDDAASSDDIASMLRAERDSLKAEVSRLDRANKANAAAADEQLQRAVAAEADVSRLREQLQTYEGHDLECNSDRHTPPSCSCLGRARRETERLREQLQQAEQERDARRPARRTFQGDDRHGETR